MRALDCLDAFFNAVDGAFVACDTDGNICAVNASAARLLGVDRDALLGLCVSDIIRDAGEKEDRRDIFEALATKTEFPVVFSHAGLGEKIVRISIVTSDESAGFRFVQLRAFNEVSELEQLARHARGEAHHRIRNALATVRYIASYTAENAKNLEEFRALFHDRMDSVSRALTLVVSDSEHGIELTDLLFDELARFDQKANGVLNIEGPPVYINAGSAVTFALTINELIFHSLKHGALGSDEGEIRIRWHIVADRDGSSASQLVFTWEEPGAQVLRPVSGFDFGIDLILNGLPYELGASTSFYRKNGAATFEITVPLGAIESAPGQRLRTAAGTVNASEKM